MCLSADVPAIDIKISGIAIGVAANAVKVWSNCYITIDKPLNRSKVVHIYDVERGCSVANKCYTQQNSNIDLVKEENSKYIVCLLIY
jgi:hypothetical protein